MRLFTPDQTDQPNEGPNIIHDRDFSAETGHNYGLHAVITCQVAHITFFRADLGGTTVAIFPTETADTIRYVLEHSEASLLFVDKLDGWEQQARGVPPGLPCIALPLVPPAGFETWDAIVARTAPIDGRPARRAGDLAMLLYTSGSTGQPKGVMQTFGSVTRVAEGIVADQVANYGDGHPIRMISYLPLAHCFERAWVECRSLVQGDSRVFFGDSLATFIDDVKRARPTVFISVPRLLTKLRQGVLATMPAAQLRMLVRSLSMVLMYGRRGSRLNDMLGTCRRRSLFMII